MRQSQRVAEGHPEPPLERAITFGTAPWLRAGDARHAAVAAEDGASIISWDRELLRRANATAHEGRHAQHAGSASDLEAPR